MRGLCHIVSKLIGLRGCFGDALTCFRWKYLCRFSNPTLTGEVGWLAGWWVWCVRGLGCGNTRRITGLRRGFSLVRRCLRVLKRAEGGVLQGLAESRLESERH